MKNLSNEKMIVGKLFKTYGNATYTDFSPLFGEGAARIREISSRANCDYYNILIGPSERIVCGKSSHTEIRRVEQGIFAGAACIIEVEGGTKGKTTVTVVHEKGEFKFPQFDHCPTPEELDYKFETPAIQDIIATSLNTFELRRFQPYVFLCEGLPKQVWQDETFITGVKSRFEALGEVNVIADIDKRFIDTEECKQVAREYLDGLCAKKTNESRFTR